MKWSVNFLLMDIVIIGDIIFQTCITFRFCLFLNMNAKQNAFPWFTSELMHILCVISRFQIWDLSSENQFVVNLRFSVCFDSQSTCLLDKVIFNEKRLPKNVCDFATAAKSKLLYNCLGFLKPLNKQNSVKICLSAPIKVKLCTLYELW